MANYSIDTFSQKDLKEFQENFWLGLGDVTKIRTGNPFDKKDLRNIENPALFIVDLMRKPENFYFTCKHLLNIELAPFQIAIIKELWVRHFPMLVGSRGLGKCVSGDTIVMTETGVDYIKNHCPELAVYYKSNSVLGENGFNNSEYVWNNGFTDNIKIVTRHGFSIEGTKDHKIRVAGNNGVVWKELQNISREDYIVIDRNASNQWYEKHNGLPSDLAYLFGLLVGDGCLTRDNVIIYTTKDKQLAKLSNFVLYKYFKKKFVKPESSKYDYRTYGIEFRKKLIDEFDLPICDSGDKKFPKCILSAPKESVAAFIRGLMDTDGWVEKHGVKFLSKSYDLAKMLHFMFARFGIISKLRKKYNKEYERYYYQVEIHGDDLFLFREKIGFRLKRKKKALDIILNRNKESNTNFDVLPSIIFGEDILNVSNTIDDKKEKIGSLTPYYLKKYNISYKKLGKILNNSNKDLCKESFERLEKVYNKKYLYDSVVDIQETFGETYDFYVPNDHSFITNNLISHNTFLLAVYSLLRCLFNQNSKVVIAGAAFRQSKFVFEYAESIYNNSPILKDILSYSKLNRPSRDVDRCSFRIGAAKLTALPIGDGSKIRGERATHLICDEMASINVEVAEKVLFGFASVSASPIQNSKEIGKIKALKELGLLSENQEASRRALITSNQTIVSGTADFAWGNFGRYWKRYRSIIESRGDEEKIKMIFDGIIPPGFNWKDYSIIRVPYNLIPEGYMDEKTIGKSKATLHKSLFIQEYGACLLPDTKVITSQGVKKIQDIRIGDEVFTHKGRFRKVLATKYRDYDGKIINYETYGCNHNMSVTEDHLFWNGGEEWTTLDKLENTKISKLKELSGLQEIDLSKVTTEFYEDRDRKFIYPKYSPSKLKNEDRFFILNSQLSIKKLAEKFKVKPATIYNVLYDFEYNKLPKKGVLPKLINLDYNFGLICGYYAAEGCSGASDRSLSFYLDGHINVKLESYVKQLQDTLERVFGIPVKKYYREDNVCCVTVNSRLAVQLMKFICPGVAHTKRMKHEILFSNPEFMKGFIVGYWNGDGHISKENKNISARSASIDLITQVRLCLSYFNICSSVNEKVVEKSLFRGKIYNCKNSFECKINSDMFKFGKLFYNIDWNVNSVNLSKGPQKEWFGRKISMVDDIINHDIFYQKKEDYSGVVYNLEVEEDQSYTLLNATTHNCFSDDTDGFFKMSLIDRCVVKPGDPIIFNSVGGPVNFNASLRGSPGCKYIMAVDPASEQDNFSVVILEIWPDHRRIVYCWTYTRAIHKYRVVKGLVDEHDFFKYCARKIRELHRLFPCEFIAIDRGGGGISIEEALGDFSSLKPGEQPIYPIVEEDDKKITDDFPGQHILVMVSFSKSEWVSDANHGMKKDFEDRILLFPSCDAITLGIAYEQDKALGRSDEKFNDTLEDCMLEIEDLKYELTTIQYSKTPTGREHWDTPETKDETAGKMKKGRLVKDRYSALLMANKTARDYYKMSQQPKQEYVHVGGFAQVLSAEKEKRRKTTSLYTGPAWFEEQMRSGGNSYGAGVRKK